MTASRPARTPLLFALGLAALLVAGARPARAQDSPSGQLGATPATVVVAPGTLGDAGLTWTTTGCSTAQVYVSMDGAVAQLFAESPSGTGDAPWIQAGHAYEFRLTAERDGSLVLAKALVVGVGPTAPPATTYAVGVDYHSTAADFGPTAFLQTYGDPAARATVLAQLQGMADRGARFVSTRIWMVSASPTPEQHWEWHFPPTPTELANLATYAKDVGSIVAADGHSLGLDLCTLWLWGADYQTGSPATTLGHENLTAAEFTSRVNATIDGVLAAVKDAKRADGSPVVETFYFDGEVMVGAKANQEWFLTTHYPSFVAKVSAAGLVPSLYFLACADEAEAMDDGFTDGTYPDLNGHRSMYWWYRSVKFLKDAGLPIPARLDGSIYVEPLTIGYDVLVKRIFDDADAALGALGCPRCYGVAETHYFDDAARRRPLGQALAAEATTRGRLVRTAFWTTPDAGGPNVQSGYPFAIEDYLP